MTVDPRDHRLRPHFLIVGDGGDLPMIDHLLRRLPVDAYGQVYIDGASASDVTHLSAPEQIAVHLWGEHAFDPESVASPGRGHRAARAVQAWLAEWMPERADMPQRPLVLWIGCSGSAPVDRLYRELHERMPHLHLHHPH